MTASNHLFINGKWQQGGGGIFTSLDPSTGEVIWQGSSADESDIEAAVMHARRAFSIWGRRDVNDRRGYIEKFAEVVKGKAENLAQIIAQETGKILWEARGEASAVIAKIPISIQAYEQRTGGIKNTQQGFINRLEHRPHGVFAVYGPYNFPAHLPNGHMIPALLAGNCVILKPSELTPAVGEFMVRCWEEARIPPGVVQLLQGAKDTGIQLSKASGLDGILFTGSVPTGIALHKQMAGQLNMMLALELGGNNPLIVWDVKDIDAAVAVIVQSAFASTGQRCTCARRLIVRSGDASRRLLERLVEVSRALAIGAWNAEPPPFMGPLISVAAAAHAADAYTQLVQLGGAPLLEMMQQEGSAFITPAIVDMTAVSGNPDEEIFAPLLKLFQVDSFDAAMIAANNTRYGLAAGLITDSPEITAQFMREIRAGVIAINRPTTGASSAMPFGGIGLSGNHRPSAFYAADYCAYPQAAQITEKLEMPQNLPPGMVL